MRTNAGADKVADALASTTGDSGTATGVTATTMTDSGKAWTVNQWAGKQVVLGGVLGTVVSNTATALTIDRWATPSNIGGATASTPAVGVYVVLPGQAPAPWIALTENATAPALTDTALTSELSGSGWTRALATYAHTAGASSYTLSRSFTSADATTRSVAKYGVLDGATGGRLTFESLFAAVASMLSGDVVNVTATVNT